MAKKKQLSHQTTRLYLILGGLACALLAFFIFVVPRTPDINEATYNGIGVGAVPSVTLTTASGQSYTYSYGIGGGFSGNKKRMDGATVDGYFYPWNHKGPAPAGFNPSKGVMFTTADGRYTTYGSSVIEQKPPLVFKPAVRITPSTVTLKTSTGASYTYAYANLDGKMNGVATTYTTPMYFYPWGYNDVAKDFNPSKAPVFASLDGKYTTYGSTVVTHNPALKFEVVSAPPTSIVVPPTTSCKQLYAYNGKRCAPTTSSYSADQKNCSSGTTFCSEDNHSTCYSTWSECMKRSILGFR